MVANTPNKRKSFGKKFKQSASPFNQLRITASEVEEKIQELEKSLVKSKNCLKKLRSLQGTLSNMTKTNKNDQQQKKNQKNQQIKEAPKNQQINQKKQAAPQNKQNHPGGEQNQPHKGKQNQNLKITKDEQEESDSEEDEEVSGEDRYAVFVGNLSYTATKDELTEHLKKVGNLVDILLIPTDQNTKKPRGFAYIELKDEEGYQRALSLNHTFIGGRRIPVLYTQYNQKGEIKGKKQQFEKRGEEDEEVSGEETSDVEEEEASSDDDDDEEEAAVSDEDEEEQQESSDDEEGSGEKDEEEEGSGEEEEDSEDGDNQVVQQKNKQPAKTQGGNKNKQDTKLDDADGKCKLSRYVVFVGNLSYTATKDELTEHFEKVGNVVDVRIPTDKNTKKPRGFAYVELKDEESYQRALDLHHTFIGGRLITVLFTTYYENGEIKQIDFENKFN